MRTGKPIVYTSADSVFQIAAHEDVVPIDGAVSLVRDRVRARGRRHGRRARHRAPVHRRAGRLPPHGQPPRLRAGRRSPRRCSTTSRRPGCPVVAIGKIEDLFAGRGITSRDPHGQRRAGHGRGAARDGDDRRAGSSSPTSWTSTRSTATATTSPATPPTSSGSTRASATLLPRLGPGDLLVVTADHGNDPTTPSTDHAREYVPVFLAGAARPRRRRSRHAPDVRGSRSDAGGSVRRRPAAGRQELPGEISLACRRSGVDAVTHPRAARAARTRDPRAAGRQERRHARPAAAGSRKIRSGRRSSAIATA